jgi:hypothetical protein
VRAARDVKLAESLWEASGRLLGAYL